MPKTQPIFDIAKAKAVVSKGRRAKWWQRRGTMKRGFYYLDAAGAKITHGPSLEHLKSLVIPPAWSSVRINPSAGGRVQAVGIDTTGRVQYIYHPSFVQKQQRKKFAKIETFGEYLPQLRAVTNEHIVLEGFPREKVLAIIIRLINSLYIRVGSEKSARHFRTYGVTTLKNNHLTIGKKGELLFEFVGKSHVPHRKVLVDAELAAVMSELKNIGVKRKLFHYINDDGKPRPVKPGDINAYIKSATAPNFSAKDFRTWGATLLAAVELAEIGPADDLKAAEKNIVKAVKKVAAALGNTPTVCRGSYIHPAVLKAYLAGVTVAEFRPRRSRSISRVQAGEDLEEKALLRMFQSQHHHG
ncbi:MAG: DNA topoisomerase IB [Acidobacteriota bacterium]